MLCEEVGCTGRKDLKLLYAKVGRGGREPPAEAQALRRNLSGLASSSPLPARRVHCCCSPHLTVALDLPPPPCSALFSHPHDSHRRFVLVLCVCVCARSLRLRDLSPARLSSRLDLTRRAPTAPGCASVLFQYRRAYTPYHIQHSCLLVFAPTRLLQRARRVRAIRSARRRRRIPSRQLHRLHVSSSHPCCWLSFRPRAYHLMHRPHRIDTSAPSPTPSSPTSPS
jgi:hypothetical protein